jgi:hypothetical protein
MYGLKPIPTFPVKPHSVNEIYGTAEAVPFVERAVDSGAKT